MNRPSKENPCGLDGFAFLEFSGPDSAYLHKIFHQQGFTEHATHQTKPISMLQQGDIQFIINTTPNSQAVRHAQTHGAGACAMGKCNI